jgi:DNA-binding HxlR family transcriptional regulator
MLAEVRKQQVPPKVEYGLTDWGEALCPALDEMLKWAASRDEFGSTPMASRTFR